MGVGRTKRVTDSGVTDELVSDDLVTIYTIEYEGLTMENFGIAMVSLLTALPDERLWNKPSIYQKDEIGVIYIEGVKKKVFEEVSSG